MTLTSEVRISRSSGQGQGHSSKEACPRMLFADGIPSTERPTCLTKQLYQYCCMLIFLFVCVFVCLSVCNVLLFTVTAIHKLVYWTD